MEILPIWAFLILFFLVFPGSNSVKDDDTKALVQFMDELSQGSSVWKSGFGWNMSSDPCRDHWHGVYCDKALRKVRRVVLEKIGLDGSFDAGSLCTVKSVVVLSLQYNNVAGEIPAGIEKCKSLTHLYLSGNKFSGKLPESISMLSNLKRLHIANNRFNGDLPNLPRISGLISFLAENNSLSGPVPSFDFSNFDHFDISNNNFSGPIPDVKGKFKAESFLGNPYLCGKPLPNGCPEQTVNEEKPKKFSAKQLLVYSGYAIIGLVVLVFVTFKLLTRKKTKDKEEEEVKKGKSVAQEKSTVMPSSTTTSGEFKHGKSEYSLTSIESGMVPTLMILRSSVASRGLTFEKLLRAPAELIGRGKRGSLYKVAVENGAILAVKRIKEWGISAEDFDRRMRRIDQVGHHRNVMPPVAYYGSRQEKLLVYEFQQNGSLFKLLHESQSSQAFEWGSRLTVASTIADALSFMHESLREDDVAHGNLKSTNILFSETMEPCISEYGLMVVDENQVQLSSASSPALNSVKPEDHFKSDIYAFGVIVLELLTGKLVQKNGFDLPNWVQSVVGEECTVGVFDKALIRAGANEERMVKLLQVAMHCVDPCPDDRPEMSQVSRTISEIKEEEEKSISFVP